MGNGCVVRTGVKCGIHEKQTPDGLGCMPRCGPMFKLSRNGQDCILDCPKGYIATRDGKGCMASCGENEVRTPDGLGCMVWVKRICPRGYASHHGQECTKIICGPGNMLDHIGKNCISRMAAEFYALYAFHMRCNSRQRMIYSDGGGCEYCPEYQRAFDSDPWICQMHTCGIRQILLPNGLCSTCPPYQEARKFYCLQQHCSRNERLRSDGVCERCPARWVQS